MRDLNTLDVQIAPIKMEIGVIRSKVMKNGRGRIEHLRDVTEHLPLQSAGTGDISSLMSVVFIFLNQLYFQVCQGDISPPEVAWFFLKKCCSELVSLLLLPKPAARESCHRCFG